MLKKPTKEEIKMGFNLKIREGKKKHNVKNNGDLEYMSWESSGIFINLNL